MTVRTYISALLAMLALALPESAIAQIRASELGTVSQTIDGTTITITYSRPQVRGRDPLFGNSKVVHWDEVWTPGANWATTLAVSKAVKLDGHSVLKGTYSVWMVVRKNGVWTVVLDSIARRYHMYPPDSTAAQIRFPVHIKDAPFVEVLTWSLPALRPTGGTLAVQWGRTRVEMNVDVEPSLPATLAEADAMPYLGRYEYVEKKGFGKGTKTFVVYYDAGTMKGRFEPVDEYYDRFALIRIAPDWFAPGIYDDNGRIYEVLRPEMTFEFKRENGRASSLEVRFLDDQVRATATRIP